MQAFSVGFRAEHLQSEIEKSLYHEAAGHPALPRGEYQLSQHVGDRCVYTFCMCPGGQVVASASETGHVVTNGMSYHARDGKNANAAVVVSVGAEDFAGDPRRAIAFQRELEAKAYAAGRRGGAYAAPAENVQSFLEGKGQLNIGRVELPMTGALWLRIWELCCPGSWPIPCGRACAPTSARSRATPRRKPSSPALRPAPAAPCG